MRYRLLGPTGLRVSELCLGTMTFGPDWGWGAERDESLAMFDAFAEAGGNFIDRKLSQLTDNIGCVDVTLSDEQLQRLNEISKIERGFPYDFIKGGRTSWMGSVVEKVDDHRHTLV